MSVKKQTPFQYSVNEIAEKIKSNEIQWTYNTSKQPKGSMGMCMYIPGYFKGLIHDGKEPKISPLLVIHHPIRLNFSPATREQIVEFSAKNEKKQKEDIETTKTSIYLNTDNEYDSPDQKKEKKSIIIIGKHIKDRLTALTKNTEIEGFSKKIGTKPIFTAYKDTYTKDMEVKDREVPIFEPKIKFYKSSNRQWNNTCIFTLNDFNASMCKTQMPPNESSRLLNGEKVNLDNIQHMFPQGCLIRGFLTIPNLVITRMIVSQGFEWKTIIVESPESLRKEDYTQFINSSDDFYNQSNVTQIGSNCTVSTTSTSENIHSNFEDNKQRVLTTENKEDADKKKKNKNKNKNKGDKKKNNKDKKVPDIFPKMGDAR